MIRRAMQEFQKLIINLAEINESSNIKEKEFLLQKLKNNLNRMNANPFGIKMWLEDQSAAN
jgi:hypothetical protein